MPEQKFMDPATDDEVIRIHWDFALTSVDVASGASFLTKITDIARLRATGFSGPSPDGGSLLIKLASGDKFEVCRNNEYLLASEVDPFGRGAGAAANPVVDSKVTLDNKGRLMINGQRMDRVRPPVADESAIWQSRAWLLFFSVVNSLLAALVICAQKFAPRLLEATPRSVAATDAAASIYANLDDGLVNAMKGAVPLVVAVLFGFAATMWVLWYTAGGPSSRDAFTISKWIAVGFLIVTGLTAGASVMNGSLSTGLVRGLIGGSVGFLAFRPFRRAQVSLPRTRSA